MDEPSEVLVLSKEDIGLWPFIKRQYNHVFFDGQDPRMIEWPLMGRPYFVVSMCFFYITLVCWILPWYMRGREPMKLKKTMMVYNLYQVCFNILIIRMMYLGGWFNGNSFICRPVDYSVTPQTLITVASVWCYFISRAVDWLDTVFVVLRKNYKQISFLHVGHHVSMPFVAWYAGRYLAVSQASFVCFLNSCVHVIMYSYYFLSGLGPRYQKYLGWKRYLTLIQIIQFLIMMAHQYQLFFVECEYPTYARMWGLVGGPVAVVFFYDFYVQAYVEKRAGRKSSLVHMAQIFGEKYACFPEGSFQVFEEDSTPKEAKAKRCNNNNK